MSGATSDGTRDGTRDGAVAWLGDLLASFRHAEDPSAPAQRVWEAASPRFRSKLGGVEHLAQLFGNPAWAPLIGHAHATIEEYDRIDDAARATLSVVTADGANVRYLASLTRLRDANTSTWRLSGLVRAELADA